MRRSRSGPTSPSTCRFNGMHRGRSRIINPPTLAGIHDEAGIEVTHRIDLLAIRKVDEQGSEVEVQGVTACWLLGRTGAGSHLTSRLAIPSSDPLAWCTRFEYAEPGSVIPVPTFRLQTFGAGPAQDFAIDAGTGLATLVAEQVRITSRRPFHLVPAPWVAAYGRTLTGSDLIDISVLDRSFGSTRPLPVKAYQLRIIGIGGEPPRIGIRGGTIDSTTELQHFENGVVEWSLTIVRQQAEYRMPLTVNGNERPVRLAAVGFVVDDLANVGSGTRTVLSPGKYRLRLEGQSHARKGSGSAVKNWTRIARDFEVVRPPLRPYIRFATFGDERIFGLQRPGWNPNPVGTGFGHYQDHIGLIRARVSYLSSIYDRLWFSSGDNVAPIPLRIQPARDGTLAGSRASQDWEIQTGVPPAREEELEAPLPREPGLRSARVYFSASGDGSDINLGKPLDVWSYRVASYPNPTAHLKPVDPALRWEFGPSGARSLALPPASPIPAGFTFAASPPARTKAGWPLPEAIAKLADIGNPRASLGCLQILEWAGAFLVRGSAQENVLNHPPAPELCLLRDSTASPVGLLLRTSEPCDWRRVEVCIVTGDLAAEHCRFSTRLAPLSDGCSCLMLLEADGVPMRVPSGYLAMELRFALGGPSLPRLTHATVPDRVTEVFSFSFLQPFGPAWPL